MPPKISVINRLDTYKDFAKKENRSKIDEVIQLYKTKQIPNKESAFKLAYKLAGTKIQAASGVRLLEAYKDKDATGGKVPRFPGALKTFFVRGKIQTTEYFYKRTKVKGQRGEKHNTTYNETYPMKQTINAKSEADAKRKFTQMAHEGFDFDHYHHDSKVSKVVIEQIEDKGNYKASHASDQQMTSAKPATYDFIPADGQHDRNIGMCFFDTFMGIYGCNEKCRNKITKLTLDKLIQLCKEFYATDPRYKIHPLDIGIVGLEDGCKWKPEDGVSPSCVEHICKHFNISMYAYDISKKCFMKYISTARNRDALIYYCVDNHMYWVSDKEAALSMARKARDIEVNISSTVFSDDVKKTNIYTDATIYDNVPIQDLMKKKYKNCIIIYDQSNLNEELDEIIKLYNVIPTVRNHKYNTIGIKLCKNKNSPDHPLLLKNIYLTTDPNDTKIIDYRGVRDLCVKHSVEFENQSFSTLVKQLRSKFYNKKHERHQFTPQERGLIHEKY